MQSTDLVGVWLLQSFYFEDIKSGERSQPFGEEPEGTIIFHPDGRFFALMTPGERPDPLTEAEQALAFRKLVAYSGPYRLEPPNRLVTTVDISWFEPWIGTDQVRYFTLKGDDLYLQSAPLSMPKADGEAADVFAIVAWRREKGRVSDGPA